MKECCKVYLSEQFGGDADVMGMIYDEYVTSVREKVEDAAAKLAAADWTTLDRIAHTIKGNALAAGDTDTANTAIELRKAAALSDVSLSTSLIDKIRELSKEL